MIEMMTEKSTNPRVLVGRVVTKKHRTVTVLVTRQVKEQLYGKYVRRTSKIHADDPENKCQKGDLIKIIESAPVSKTKLWVLGGILEKTAE